MSIEEFLERSGQSGITREDITGRSRIGRIAVAREAYWYYLSLQGLGHSAISRLAGRGRSTVMSGIRSVRGLFEVDHPLIRPYKKVVESV